MKRRISSLFLGVVVLSMCFIQYASANEVPKETEVALSPFTIAIDPTQDVSEQTLYFTEKEVLDDGTVVMEVCDDSSHTRAGTQVAVTITATRISSVTYSVTVEAYVPYTSIRSFSATISYGDQVTATSSASLPTPSTYAIINYGNHTYPGSGTYMIQITSYRMVVNSMETGNGAEDATIIWRSYEAEVP